MSNLTLSANPLGTGTFIVQSPNSNTNNTLTLPDATTTLVGTSDFATLAEAQAGTSNTKLMTPLRVTDLILSDIATQAEAQAGTDTTKLMTPQRTSQAIAALSPPNYLNGTITSTTVFPVTRGVAYQNTSGLARLIFYMSYQSLTAVSTSITCEISPNGTNWLTVDTGVGLSAAGTGALFIKTPWPNNWFARLNFTSGGGTQQNYSFSYF